MNDFELRIVCLGASATAGTPGFFSPRERPPHGEGNEESQYAYWMRKSHPEWEVLNRGMRGQRTDQILARFEYDVFDQEPDCMILLAGTNDLYQGYDAEAAIENLAKMYRLARSRGIQPIACSILPLDLADPELKERILDFNAALAIRAKDELVPFCDLYSALEHEEKSGYLMASPDQVHPDVAGYRRMGEALTQVLEELLSET